MSELRERLANALEILHQTAAIDDCQVIHPDGSPWLISREQVKDALATVRGALLAAEPVREPDGWISQVDAAALILHGRSVRIYDVPQLAGTDAVPVYLATPPAAPAQDALRETLESLERIVQIADEHGDGDVWWTTVRCHASGIAQDIAALRAPKEES